MTTVTLPRAPGATTPGARRATRHRGTTPLAVVGSGLAWAVVTLAVGVLVAAVLLPRLAGATPYSVLTGSMTPAYPPGSLVVVRPVAAEDVAVGDVLTYQRESGRASVVTHRVVSVASSTVDGSRTYLTRGDANPVVDADPVRPVQVKGELWYAVPWLGHLHSWLSGDQRQWATYGVGAGLLAYATVMLLGAGLDRRRRRAGEVR